MLLQQGVLGSDSVAAAARGRHSVVCRHWWRGACMRGAACDFLHRVVYFRMPKCRVDGVCLDAARYDLLLLLLLLLPRVLLLLLLLPLLLPRVLFLLLPRVLLLLLLPRVYGCCCRCYGVDVAAAAAGGFGLLLLLLLLLLLPTLLRLLLLKA